ncbi:SGNH/GDSL hydrolase family protein [Schlesneria sp. DSM 10557]|uniref:SGNH/GDSL hydrolase family protein n=1 Tax=Schlesneria sp. DSM 10557 TaxID=3044399 RepID=UPI0035A0A8EA
MLRLRQWCLIVLTCFASTLPAPRPRAESAEFFFKDGDVVVMIGDSITEQHLYSNYVEMWTVTRFPHWKLTFRNVGIGGDTSGGGNARFARDVLAFKPTAMTVDFGMNDGRYRAFEEATFNPYMNGLQGMADQARAASIRTAWITPQPLDDGAQGPTALTGYNLTLEKFSDGVKTIAEKNGGIFVDQFHPYLTVLDRARKQHPKYERITGGDAVHPGPPGQALMAASILKGLNFPSFISSTEIDVKSKKVVSQTNCKVEVEGAAENRLSFNRTDVALPFFPMEAFSILEFASILDDLNEYQLKVTGLPEGKYEIQVGGKVVAERTSEQLANGVNLAAGVLANGTIADQVKEVRAAIEKKNRFHHQSIFRGIVLTSVPAWVHEVISEGELTAKRNELIQKRLSQLPALDEEVAKALVMKPHRFDIVPKADSDDR